MPTDLRLSGKGKFEMLNFIRNNKLKIVLGIAAILLAIAFIVVNFSKTYNGYNLISEIERQADTNYEINANKLICYNGEGIFALGENLKSEWNVAVNMVNPKLTMNNSFLAIFDAGGRTIFVINSKDGGKPTKLEVLSDIMQVDISEQGEIAALMQENDGYKIQIINPYDNNKLKAEIKTYTKDGYALTLALSDDGTRLVTEYIKTGDKIKSILTFYNFGKAGENLNADRIVGIFPYEDTLFPKLKFIDNRLCAFGDNKIACFEAKREPKLLWEEEIKDKILKLSLAKDGFVFNTDDKITAYNYDGSKVFEKNTSINVKKLRYDKGEIIICSDDNCLIYHKKCEKYKGKFPERISTILSINDDKYYIITDKKISVIKLKE